MYVVTVVIHSGVFILILKFSSFVSDLVVVVVSSPMKQHRH
jgi:hypothetical protein